MIVGLMNCMRTCVGSLLAKNRITTKKRFDLAKSFLSQSEEEYQFMMKWIFDRPKPFCDFIFSLCIKNESRTNINP